MSNPLSNLFFGTPSTRSDLVEVIEPRRTFTDVVLPAATRRALDHALTQIEKHDQIFNRWGLAERHSMGLGLAFNFAGPPGTGKTICAEAVAHTLGRRLLVVRYADLESMWMGSTGKNVAAVFRLAQEEEAVLFFDEADAIAARRSTAVDFGYQRETNAVVSILLREVEAFPGVVIFATNLAANFDPAFERRIRTHILFEMPDVEERARIWEVQLHPQKTPLAPDVDFQALAERFEVSGGDIKNAVLKAAQRAAAEPGPDAAKQIHQHHFAEAMQEVLTGRQVMGQSLFGSGDGLAVTPAVGPFLEALSQSQDHLQQEIRALSARLDEAEAAQQAARQEDEAARTALESMERRTLFYLALTALITVGIVFAWLLLG